MHSGKRNWDSLTALSLFLPDLEMAVAYWNLVFSRRLKFLDLWNILLLVSGFLLAGAPREGSVGAVASVLTVGPGPRAEVTKQQTRGHALPPAESDAQGLCPGCSEAASSGRPTSAPPTPSCAHGLGPPRMSYASLWRSGGLSWPRGGGSFGPGSRLWLRGGCRVRAALTSGSGRAVLLRPPRMRGAALPPGGGVGAVWESPPGAAWGRTPERRAAEGHRAHVGRQVYKSTLCRSCARSEV